MKKNILLIPLILFAITYMLRALDIFVFHLDELLGEIILSKALGFGLIAWYVRYAGRSLKDIGFHSKALGRSLWLGGLTFAVVYALGYGIQLFVLKASEPAASLVFSAVDPKTGKAGGALFALWLVIGNIVNSGMEEGLFRGVMMTHFSTRMKMWKALGLQALLFASWHWIWPLKSLINGSAETGDILFELLALTVSTTIGGLIFGYLYYRTNNLWSAFLAHFINNGVFNIVFLQTGAGMQSGVEFPIFIAIWLGGYLALLPVIYLLTKSGRFPAFTPWPMPENQPSE